MLFLFLTNAPKRCRGAPLQMRYLESMIESIRPGGFKQHHGDFGGGDAIGASPDITSLARSRYSRSESEILMDKVCYCSLRSVDFMAQLSPRSPSDDLQSSPFVAIEARYFHCFIISAPGRRWRQFPSLYLRVARPTGLPKRQGMLRRITGPRRQSVSEPRCPCGHALGRWFGFQRQGM